MRREAVALVALVDGFLLHLLSDPGGVALNAALGALDAHLDRLFHPAESGGCGTGSNLG